MKKTEEIKKLVKNQCLNSKGVPDWFYKEHLLEVSKNAEILIQKLSLDKKSREVVLLGVWLHDLQRIRSLNGDHQKIGAREAEKVMKQFGYKDEIVKNVKKIILTHSCTGKNTPDTLEGRVLASADAMSHYTGDFFLRIAVLGERDLSEYKKWVLEKLERNYTKKISFRFAKKIIKKRHNIIKDFILNS